MAALKRIRPRIEIDPVTGTPSFSFGINGESNAVLLHTIDDFFAFIGEEFSADQIIVCFDEFQSVLNYPNSDEMMAQIRGKLQYHSFPYIFTGSDHNGLKSIFTDPCSPFYKSVRPLEVQTIPRKDFQPFLANKFTTGKRKLSDSAWESIFELDVPGDVQQLCAALWDVSDPSETISLPALGLAYERIFAQELEGFRTLLSGLTALQLRVLESIANNGTINLFSMESQQTIGASGSSIRRSLTALERKWILANDHGEIYFNNPFLKQFLRMNQL
jgi:hypothetical protein